MAKVTIYDVMEQFKLELIAGESGSYRPIMMSDISRPGIEIAGFFTYYPAKRIQLLGQSELAFFAQLDHRTKCARMEQLCTYDTPGIIISRGLEVPVELINAANRMGVPVLRSNESTTTLISRITSYLDKMLAPVTALHGVLVDIFDVGVLITGISGIGKSEVALDLVTRGHRLVADDSVEIRQEQQGTLIGRSPELIKHLLEIRGLGIINIKTMFGAESVLPYKEIALCVHLEMWNRNKAYDRLGLEEEQLQIIDTHIPKLTVPVRPGRNLAVIVEVAARNHRLKRSGLNAAQDFSDRLTRAIEEDEQDDC